MKQPSNRKKGKKNKANGQKKSQIHCCSTRVIFWSQQQKTNVEHQLVVKTFFLFRDDEDVRTSPSVFVSRSGQQSKANGCASSSRSNGQSASIIIRRRSFLLWTIRSTTRTVVHTSSFGRARASRPTKFRKRGVVVISPSPSAGHATTTEAPSSPSSPQDRA